MGSRVRAPNGTWQVLRMLPLTRPQTESDQPRIVATKNMPDLGWSEHTLVKERRVGAVASPFEEPTEKVQNVKWINSGFR